MFAVTTIEAWWQQVGRKRYPHAREIFITADAGGSNSYRSHVWKHQLQRVAVRPLAFHARTRSAHFDSVAVMTISLVLTTMTRRSRFHAGHTYVGRSTLMFTKSCEHE